MTAKNPAAQALGRLGGKAKSEAKTEAVRANGAKGGRPKGKTPAQKSAAMKCVRAKGKK